MILSRIQTSVCLQLFSLCFLPLCTVALEQRCGSWLLYGGIKELSCFMSSVTLTEDKREVVVIRNKVPVTFEVSFDIHPSLFLTSPFPPTASLVSLLPPCLSLILFSIPSQSPGFLKIL